MSKFYLTVNIEGEDYIFLDTVSDGMAYSIVDYLDEHWHDDLMFTVLTGNNLDKKFLEEYNKPLYNQILKRVVEFSTGVPNIFEGVSMVFLSENTPEESSGFTAEQLMGDRLNITDCTIKNSEKPVRNRSHLKVIK
tara:strand:- start:2311 stop:2718 length:408 start_codon:yes stop_codon:yes gene_type:complete